MLTNTMKAARFHRAREMLRVEEVPVPQCGSGEVLIKVKATGICGSDLHILEGITPTGFIPITLGHEFAGVVVEVGSQVVDWKPGDRVCVHSLISCDSCYNCRRGRESVCINRKALGIHLDGGLAEYVRVPARNLIRLPDSIPFDQGAIISDAVATPYHAMVKRGGLSLGDSVAIFGVGGLGYHAILIALAAGATKIIAVDVLEESLERALAAGATDAINASKASPPEQIRMLTKGQGVDIAVECIGLKKTIADAASAVRPGGKVIAVGLGPESIQVQPPTVFVRSEIELVGSYWAERGEIEKLVDLVASGRLDLGNSITERITLEDVNIGLEHLEKKVGNPIRIVVVQD